MTIGDTVRVIREIDKYDESPQRVNATVIAINREHWHCTVRYPEGTRESFKLGENYELSE